MGDIHPQGNPHYWLPPENALIIAREIAERLARSTRGGAATYERNLAAFESELTPSGARSGSSARRRCAGMKVVTYHKSWTYVSQVARPRRGRLRRAEAGHPARTRSTSRS